MEPNEKHIIFDIKTGALLKVVGLILLVALLYFIRDLVVILLAALILAAVINPLADWFQKRRVHRGVAVLITYILILALLTLIVMLIFPPIRAEISDFSSNFGSYLNKIKTSYAHLLVTTEQLGFADNLISQAGDFGSGIGKAATGVYATVAGVLGGLVSVILIFVFAFYLVVEKGNLKNLLSFALPQKYHSHLENYFDQISGKISSWIRGQIILGIIIGFCIWSALSLLGIKYALVLALFAALLEFIPFVGPIITAIPAVILALAYSPLKAVIVVVIFWAINRLENDVLVPKIMQRATGLNPVITLLAVAVGFKLGGVLGIILAVPTATAFGVIIKDILERRPISD